MCMQQYMWKRSLFIIFRTISQVKRFGRRTFVAYLHNVPLSLYNLTFGFPCNWTNIKISHTLYIAIYNLGHKDNTPNIARYNFMIKIKFYSIVRYLFHIIQFKQIRRRWSECRILRNFVTNLLSTTLLTQQVLSWKQSEEINFGR